MNLLAGRHYTIAAPDSIAIVSLVIFIGKVTYEGVEDQSRKTKLKEASICHASV
jgi:hypothetical protein